MKKGILKDEEKQYTLNKNGFVVIDLLDGKQINKCLEAFKEDELNLNDEFYITMEHTELETRRVISKKLTTSFYKVISHFFYDFKLFQGSYLFKKSNSNYNFVNKHQDWSFVDESKGFNSYVVWIALQDIELNMGAISVYEGSHKKIKQVRFTPNEYFNGYEKIHEYTNNKNPQLIEVKAGEAIIWDTRLIHFSEANTSENDRLNITLGVTSKNAQLKLYWKSPFVENELLEFDVPDDFYFRQNSSTLLECYNNKTYPDNLMPVQKHQI